MSEEFGCSIRIKCDEFSEMEFIQKVSSFLDNEDYENMTAEISAYDFKADENTINELMKESCYLRSLAKTLALFSDQSRAELGIESDFGMSCLSEIKEKKNGVYKFVGGGTDREAYEFCRCLAIFLFAVTNNDLTVKGGGSFWGGSWSITKGVMAEKFKEFEE